MSSADRSVLEFDCGNSAAKWRLLSDQLTVEFGVVNYEEGFDSVFETIASFGQHILGCRVASVAEQEVNERLFLAWRSFSAKPIQFAKVTRGCANVTCGYRDVSQMGVDRWSAIIAASKLIGGPFVVADAGTAFTADFVQADGQHSGGYILPGFGLMLDALRQNTAIPSERIPSLAAMGSDNPGKDTESAISNALCLYVRSLFEGLMGKIDAGAKLLLTGGQAGLIVECLALDAILAPDLVLDGLAVLLPMEAQQ